MLKSVINHNRTYKMVLLYDYETNVAKAHVYTIQHENEIHSYLFSVNEELRERVNIASLSNIMLMTDDLFKSYEVIIFLIYMYRIL